MRTGSSRNSSIESWWKNSRTRIESAVLTQHFCIAWRATESLFLKLIRGSIISVPAANVLGSSIGLKWRLRPGGDSELFCTLLPRALVGGVCDAGRVSR